MGYTQEQIKYDLENLTIIAEKKGKMVIKRVKDKRNLTLAQRERHWAYIERYWVKNKPTEKIDLSEEEENIEAKKRAKLAQLFRWMRIEDERVDILTQMEFGKDFIPRTTPTISLSTSQHAMH